MGHPSREAIQELSGAQQRFVGLRNRRFLRKLRQLRVGGDCLLAGYVENNGKKAFSEEVTDCMGGCYERRWCYRSGEPLFAR